MTVATARLGFGVTFTDHMVVANWSQATGWTPLSLTRNAPLSLHPAAMSLHYGQAIFEGLKAYRQPDGTAALFTPHRNAERFARSAARLAMPQLPPDAFIEACELLVRADAEAIPGGFGQSLYLRPFMIATEASLGVRAATEYLFAVIASPVDHFFASGPAAIDVWCESRHSRAASGGTGEAKCAGNYAGSMPAKAAAVARGCHEVLWLDAAEGNWVEELSAMNFFCVRQPAGDQPELLTPPLGGTILHGSTRAALLTLAGDHGVKVTERPIALAELLDPDSPITEAFACGTAATVVPIGGFASENGQRRLPTEGVGPVTTMMLEALMAIQYGRSPDTHRWMHRVDGVSLP